MPAAAKANSCGSEHASPEDTLPEPLQQELIGESDVFVHNRTKEHIILKQTKDSNKAQPYVLLFEADYITCKCTLRLVWWEGCCRLHGDDRGTHSAILCEEPSLSLSIPPSLSLSLPLSFYLSIYLSINLSI